jgi:hypothetical protein
MDGPRTARADAEGRTELLGVHEGLSRGVFPADNETDWRMSPGKLAAFGESG